MINNKLTIGQMAKINHTTVSTLRLYERLGLLVPATINPENGYRYYDMEQSAVFHTIQTCTLLGLSLKEIQSLVETNSFSMIDKMYHEKLEQVKAQIQQLSLQRHMLCKALNGLERYLSLPPEGTFTLQFLHSEYVYSEPADRDYFHEDFGSYLYGISLLYDHLESIHIPAHYQFFTGFTMGMANFLEHRYHASQLEAYVDEIYGERPQVLKRKGRLCFCTYVDDFAKLDCALEAMADHCRKNHLQVDGDLICRLLSNIARDDFRRPQPFLRLQIPVLVEPQQKSVNEQTKGREEEAE